MPIELRITFSGLMAYVIEDKKIDVLILASREHSGSVGGHHPHADLHTPALLLPMHRLKKGSSGPDMVVDAGIDAQEYGVWLLKDSFCEVRLDDKAPSGKVYYRQDPSNKPIPDDCNQDSLFWLANVSKAAMMECKYRPECLPPHPNPHFVTAAARIEDGSVVAYWSTPDAKTQIFRFRPPRDSEESSNCDPHGHATPLPEWEESATTVYRQALADGIHWTVHAEKHVDILLHSLAGARMRAITIVPIESNQLVVKAAVSNKPSTVGGKPPFGAGANEISHFGLYYDMVEPAPPLMSRRLPGIVGVSTRDSRCPGSTG